MAAAGIWLKPGEDPHQAERRRTDQRCAVFELVGLLCSWLDVAFAFFVCFFCSIVLFQENISVVWLGQCCSAFFLLCLHLCMHVMQM